MQLSLGEINMLSSEILLAEHVQPGLSPLGFHSRKQTKSITCVCRLLPVSRCVCWQLIDWPALLLMNTVSLPRQAWENNSLASRSSQWNVQPPFHTPGLYKCFYYSFRPPFILEQKTQGGSSTESLTLSSCRDLSEHLDRVTMLIMWR